jgi:hypothetical protein
MLIGAYIVVNNIINSFPPLFVFHSAGSFHYSTFMEAAKASHYLFLISGMEAPFLLVKSVQSMVFAGRIRPDL